MPPPPLGRKAFCAIGSEIGATAASGSRALLGTGPLPPRHWGSLLDPPPLCSLKGSPVQLHKSPGPVRHVLTTKAGSALVLCLCHRKPPATWHSYFPGKPGFPSVSHSEVGLTEGSGFHRPPQQRGSALKTTDMEGRDQHPLLCQSPGLSVTVPSPPKPTAWVSGI